MFFNNLRVSLRRFNRQRLNTLLHVIGLTLGISVCLLIGLFLKNEMSFDAYHEKADRIYRVNSVWVDAGKKSYHFSTPMPLAPALRSAATGVEAVAFAQPQDNMVVEINPEKRFVQDHILITDPDFLEVFHIDVVSGNAYQALRKPYQALLTESTAKKFFGHEDPIGKVFKYRNEYNMTVAGLIKDIPSNSHLPASMLLSYVPNEKFLQSGTDAWTYVSGTSTYIVAAPGFNRAGFEAQLKAIADKQINSDPNLPKFSRSYFDIQPLSDIHFNSQYAGGGEWVKAVSKTWLWFFASVGLAVLALACINFVNLSTAQALSRGKEVGVRKSMGAGKAALITQFLTEAWVLALVAGLLSLVIVQFSLPFMNRLLEKEIRFHPLQSPRLVGALLAGILVTGLLAGLYPAWIISKFNPVVTLKAGSVNSGSKGSSWLRKGLVVMQFTISTGLLIAVWLIAQQVSYVRSKNLGFNKDNVINVELKGSDRQKMLFAAELRKIPAVRDFSFSTSTPSAEGHWGTIMSTAGREDPARQQVTMIMGDDHYAEMYGLHLLSGRMLQFADTNYLSESIEEKQQISRLLVNEQLVKALGFGTPAAAIGKKFWFGMGSGNGEIVGVVSDFNTTSLHDAMKPVLILQRPNRNEYSTAGIKVSAGTNLPQLLTAIESAWKQSFPEGVFDYKFLDDRIDSFYKAEDRLYTLFRVFAGLAMLISCLGLWGLATLAAQHRTKEIGIRKVLGASVTGLVALLSKDFLRLVALALVIATPLAWYFMRQWLQDFAYRIQISGWVFVAVAAIALLLALLTVGYQAIRAAIVKPVKSLRTE